MRPSSPTAPSGFPPCPCSPGRRGEPACTPLTDEARYWVIPEDPAGVAAFLTAHAPSWLPNDGAGWPGTGGGQTISSEVRDAPRGKSFGAPAGLDFTVAALPDGMTGIRADAEVVPAGAASTRAGAGRITVTRAACLAVKIAGAVESAFRKASSVSGERRPRCFGCMASLMRLSAS